MDADEQRKLDFADREVVLRANLGEADERTAACGRPCASSWADHAIRASASPFT